jgi:hypothetical protein
VSGSQSGKRHWEKSAFTAMLPNDVQVTPEEARSMVHWILTGR